MAMIGVDLATAIRLQQGFDPPNSSMLNTWGAQIVAEVKRGTVSGSVSGTCPPSGGPLIAGAMSAGTIADLDGSRLATNVKNAVPFSSLGKLTAFCQALVDHIMDVGIVTFASGNIVGTCTNTPLSPGPLVAGAGTGGRIESLNPAVLVPDIMTAIGGAGTPALALQFATALCSYIQTASDVSFATGTIAGVCPPGGGSLTGTGSGGEIA